MKTSSLIPCLLALAGLLAAPLASSAANLVVTNLADSGPGTLRSALANAASGAVITFDPSLSGATITLSNTLTITTNLTIDASSLPGGIQIYEDNAVFFTIFNVASHITVFLNSLTISNGYSVYYPGGGGILNAGTLTLTNCILSGNYATDGGGIFNVGTLTLNQCTLSGNSATPIGADYGEGGGIYNDGALTLNQCTLSGNSAPSKGGGGIFNFLGTATLNQCTLSGNSALVYGGGIFNDHGALGMTNTVVGGNSGNLGADIYNISATLTYGGSNLVQSVYNFGGPITGPAPLTNAPDLAPLGNYGGPTQTMPPLPGSPAIGAGSMAANTFSTDQRGFPRTQNGLIDIGAVELQSPAANPPVLENITVPAGGGNGLQFTFTNAPAADFTVLTATNVSLAMTNWTVLGEVQQVAPGQYQFTDPQAATNRVRFYRVQSPKRGQSRRRYTLWIDKLRPLQKTPRMARKLRVEYPGAIYHVMNRGDRREPVFLDDPDRRRFLETLAEACAKTAWQIHAYCLMGNHFHLVLETPQGNLVAGMKWFLGTYTSRFNRRHKLFGHLFSGRYKALVVDGSSNGYLCTVCDYVHLNPVRAKLIPPERPLRDYAWSSFAEYLKAPAQRPVWLRVDRLLGEMRIPKDSPAGRAQFERLMEARRDRDVPGEWKGLRRGWCLGPDQFRLELLEQMSGKFGPHHGGGERIEAAQAKAERIVAEEMARRGWSEAAFKQRRKADAEKIKIARRLRAGTTMSWAWIAERLVMGTAGYTADSLRKR